jgi:hypothetical protein
MFTAAPSWIPQPHQQRVQSYLAYEDLYFNASTTFRLMQRGGEAEEDAIYVPTPKTIIDTVNRYVGGGIRFVPSILTGTPQSQLNAQLLFDDLLKREAFDTKYIQAKRFGLARGDWLFHIRADDTKEQGKRISIDTVHAGNFFPVYESDIIEGGNPDKLIGIKLAELTTVGEDEMVRVQYYSRQNPEDPLSPIVSTLTLWKPDEWWDPEKAPVEELRPPVVLDQRIPAFPIYHIANFRQDGDEYGSSELRGYERVLAAINQGYTDEDVTLALEGLGVYATDSPAPPRDVETGEQTTWSVYPGRVVHNAPGFRRIQGVGSVVPYSDHITRMLNSLKEASAASDAAIGRVDVAVAESGVALALELGPILSKADEYDKGIAAVMRQFAYDLRFWFEVYEGQNLQDITFDVLFGEKLPKNQRATAELVVLLMGTPVPILSAATARVWLADAGLYFDPKEADLVALDMAASAASLDPTGGREADEAAGGAPPPVVEDLEA